MTEDGPSPESSPGRTALSVEELCRRYFNDDAHSFFVAEIAKEIFQWTRPVHELPDEVLPVLEAAAKLHNVGLYFGQALHHVHSRNLILQHGLKGFDRDQLYMIACGALFHRKRVRPDEEPIFRALPEPLRTQTLRIAAIVRVADGLDYTQDQSARITFYDDTRRRVRFYIDGEDARTNVDRANRKAGFWDEVMPRPVAFAVERGQKYHLRRGDRMQAVAYKVFSRFFTDILRHEQGVRETDDIEELHQFRVSIRRLRAAMRAFRRTFPRHLLRPIRDDLRDIARTTNEARDLDVFLEALERLPSGGRVPSLLEKVHEDRRRAGETVLAMLNGLTYQHLKLRFPEFLEEIHPYQHPLRRKWARRRARRAAPQLVRRELRSVLAFLDTLDENDETQLHELRIACKRLRYVADFVGEVIEGDKGLILKPLKALQDSLGEIHDADVHGLYITQFLEAQRRSSTLEEHEGAGETRTGLSAEEEAALLSLIEENRARRDAAFRQFHAQWAEFTSEAYQERVAKAFGLPRPDRVARPEETIHQEGAPSR